MRKGGILFLICILLINSAYAVSISPAKVDGRFEPGLETVLTFSVDTQLNRELEIYLEGDLAEYMELSATKLYQKGSFDVKIKLPETIEPPGQTRTLVGVREIVDFDREIRGGIATATEVRASIYIFVPYPGKYIETALRAHDINLNEPVVFELDITSRGKESVTIQPSIAVYSESNELMDTLCFQERTLTEDQGIALTKTLDTSGYNAGNYIAYSTVSYDEGKVSKQNASFRIGELSIKIVNHTEVVEINGLQPFVMTLESGWNNIIEGAYATVRISNETTQIASFTTTPTTLEPWQIKSIQGYFNSSEAVKGEYNVFMNVYYFGGGNNKTTIKTGKINFIPLAKEIDYALTLSILLSIILFIWIVHWIFNKIFLVKIKNVRKKK